MLLPPIYYEYYYNTFFFFSANLRYPVFLGDFKEFISHDIFGNFILLKLLTLGLKLQIGERVLFG